MGHSALWVSGGGRDARIYNWGAFDSSQENFVWKFLDGTLDYRLNLESYGRTRSRAESDGRTIVAQRLDLPPTAMNRLLDILDENALPENRDYLYHWLDDNCATRVRDVLDRALEGQLTHLQDAPQNHTIREEILRHLGPNLAVWFGWHFMASSYAERTHDGWSELHVPVRLMETLDSIEVPWPDGETRDLVRQSCIKTEGSHDWAPETPPQRSTALWSIGLGWAGLIVSLGRRQSFIARMGAAVAIHLYALLPGVLGSTIFVLYFISRMEGFGPNENWLHASPLSLFLIPACWSWLRNGRRRRLWSRITVGIGTLSTLGLLMDPFTNQVNLDLIGLLWPPIIATAWLFHHSLKRDES